MFKKDDDSRVINLNGSHKTIWELVNLVDIVGYMTTINDTKETGDTKRLIIDPASDKYVAKTAPVG